MIWNAPQDLASNFEVLGCHLKEQLLAAGVSTEYADEIIQSVLTYWWEVSDQACLPTDYVAMMLSRALRGAGHDEAAYRVLGLDFDQACPDLIESALHLRRLPPSVWNVFSTALVRPTRWLVDGRLVWVLDFSKARLDESDFLEMTILQSLKRIVESVSGVWDATSGDGVLGLHGLSSSIGVLGGPKPRRRSRLGREIEEFIAAVLGNLQRERGWGAVPHLLNLDGLGPVHGPS
jgi:hypothetical protein